VERRQRLVAVPDLPRPPQIRQLLHDVDSALERLDAGTFGLCEECHDPIEAERLGVDPLVRVCLECLSEDQARALERDLESAAQIQAALLPPEHVELAGWQIDHRYRPLGGVSGDHCDVLAPVAPGDPLHFMLGDVSGKGVSASILMSHLHAILRSLARRGLALGELVAQTNRLFCEITVPSWYATLVAGRLTAGGRLEICNAGHWAPLLLRAGGITAVPSTGIPLGLFPNAEFEVLRYDLVADDLLFLYTDGLSEARDGCGEAYGRDRIHSLLGRLDRGAPEAVMRACLDDGRAFRNGAPREDDLTLMAIRRGG
jgi:sigma-B regulation protein RsbU (phosphoserine phosphatase)